MSDDVKVKCYLTIASVSFILRDKRVPVRVSVNKLILTPNRIMPGIIAFVSRNCWELSSWCRQISHTTVLSYSLFIIVWSPFPVAYTIKAFRKSWSQITPQLKSCSNSKFIEYSKLVYFTDTDILESLTTVNKLYKVDIQVYKTTWSWLHVTYSGIFYKWPHTY